MEVKIYVEGKSELVFLSAYLQEVFGFIADSSSRDKIHLFTREDTIVELKNLGGYSKLNLPDVQEDIQDDLEDRIRSLVILDADTSHNDGGFGVRKAQVEAVQATVPFEFFLIPNGTADGYLETLLSHIVEEDYHDAIKCLRGQDQCLREANTHISGKHLKVSPDKAADKAVMNTFMSRLENKGKDKFKDETIWNLNHPYLDPLKNFLTTHLT